jgi:hypothetical protein
MDNPELPTYIGTSHLARELRYRNYNLITIIRKWANDPELPCPAPDAHLYREDDIAMLWRKDRLPEWHEWNRQRINLTRERAEAGTFQGRLPKLGNQPERPLKGDQ